MSEATTPPETRIREAEHLADRYVALWNEPDPEHRRRVIGELWTEDGSQILQPPQEIREMARAPESAWRPRWRRGDTPSSRRGPQPPTSGGSAPTDSASGDATTSIGCTTWSSSTGRLSRRTAK